VVLAFSMPKQWTGLKSYSARTERWRVHIGFILSPIRMFNDYLRSYDLI